MSYYCLQCNDQCDFEWCDRCENDPAMENVEHPGFTSDAEIQQEIDSENYWEEYDPRG